MEIRRSVMARPNLSWRVKIASRLWLAVATARGNFPPANDHRPTTFFGKKTNGREHPGGRFLSNALLRSAGGAGVSTSTLGEDFLSDLCESSALSAVKVFRSERARNL